MSQYRAIELRYLYQKYRELHDTGNIPSKWYIGGAVVLWYRQSLCISIILQHRVLEYCVVFPCTRQASKVWVHCTPPFGVAVNVKKL